MKHFFSKNGDTIKKDTAHSKLFTGGFSFIELTVALAIFVVLTSLIMVSQNTLNNRVNVDTLAHQIGQWVRDAQISSMSVRRSNTASFASGYGLHFDIAQPNQFIYFADTNNNGVYNAGSDGIQQTISLLPGYAISLLCGSYGGIGIATTCGGVTSLASTNVFDITFRRPNPDAKITGDPHGSPATTEYSPARITILSPKGFARTIVVYVTGQVSIQ